jgi:hypothetical protein
MTILRLFAVSALAFAPDAHAETRPLPPRMGEGIQDYVSRLSALEQQVYAHPLNGRAASQPGLNNARATGARADIDSVRRLLDRYRSDNILTTDERRDLDQQFQNVRSSIDRARY